jgi:hypothetical protein
VRLPPLIRRSPGIAVAAAAALALAAVIAVQAGGGEKQSGPHGGDVWTRAEFFGVNAPFLRDYAIPDRQASLDALARSMASEGVRWARVVFDQSVEQRTPGAIDWSIPDAVVGSLARQRVRTQALFIGTAAWVADPEDLASCGSRSEPTDIDGWSRFVGAAVERYGRGGEFWTANPAIKPLPIETWEIGNEENTRLFWCPRADPAHYASVYAASRSAALDADPDALVIVGGLAPAFDGAGPGDMTVPDFLRGIVAADPGLTGEIPGVAIHPYAATPPLVMQNVRRFRDAMRFAGLGGVPMIVNEVGWYTSGPPGPQLASQAERAERIRRVAAAVYLTDCDVVALGIHSWETAESDPANPEDWYGLANPRTGKPNASGVAYGAAIRAADSGQPAASRAGGRVCD